MNGSPAQFRGDLPSGYVSEREFEVWRLVALGKATKEIASVMGIEIKTAEHHRESLYQKLGAHNAADATRKAVAYGVVTIDPRPLLRIITPYRKVRYLFQ